MTDDVHGAGEPIEIHSCDDVLSHVFEFLDHETDDARRAVIAEHLAARRLVGVAAAHADPSSAAPARTRPRSTA